MAKVFGRKRFCSLGLSILLLGAMARIADAQTPAPAAPQPNPLKRPTVRKHPHANKLEATPAPVPTAQPAPPAPNWPVNDQAQPPAVDWNGRTLSVSASNASLKQVLSDVSMATGVKIEGSAGDQRIYGNYGPAPARDVLNQLLDGTGYNVLMIGDQGQGTPRTLVLSAKASGQPSPNPGMNGIGRQGADEESPEEPEQPEQPDPNQNRPPGLPPGQPGMNRTPQQMIQEIEQRRLQQQQGAPQQPQPNPTPQPNN